MTVWLIYEYYISGSGKIKICLYITFFIIYLFFSDVFFDCVTIDQVDKLFLSWSNFLRNEGSILKRKLKLRFIFFSFWRTQFFLLALFAYRIIVE